MEIGSTDFYAGDESSKCKIGIIQHLYLFGGTIISNGRI